VLQMNIRHFIIGSFTTLKISILGQYSPNLRTFKRAKQILCAHTHLMIYILLILNSPIAQKALNSILVGKLGLYELSRAAMCSFMEVDFIASSRITRTHVQSWDRLARINWSRPTFPVISGCTTSILLAQTR
jgi:hypothetical protein